MNIQVHQEYLEGDDPLQDLEGLNRAASKQITKSFATSSVNSLMKSKSNNDFESNYENIIKKYEDKFSQKEKKNYNKEYDVKFQQKLIKENPISTFIRLQKEVEIIEKDLNYYLENKDKYKSIVPIETSLEELKKLKYIINYVNSSNNFAKLKKINEIENKNGIKIKEDNYNLLNKKIYNNLDEKLNQKLNNIKRLKDENPLNYKNIEYELYLTPDNEKMKLFKELDELILKINEIEEKIGTWNLNNKQNTIAANLDTIKSNMILIDKMSNKKMKKKFDAANEKIRDIKDNYKEIYDEIEKKRNDIKNKEDKLKDITSEGIDAKNAEKIICNAIYKMEILKDDHEKSIYLSQKIKELINKNEGIQEQLEENIKLLDEVQENIQLNADTMHKNIFALKQKIK